MIKSFKLWQRIQDTNVFQYFANSFFYKDKRTSQYFRTPHHLKHWYLFNVFIATGSNVLGKTHVFFSLLYEILLVSL